MAVPVFHSSDIQASLFFYTGTLGATLLWRDAEGTGPVYAAVKWQGHELHISSHSGDGVAGSVAFFPVPDVDAVYRALRATGWTPRQDRGPVFAGPTDQTWGMRELYVDDPDGNVLRFGTPLRG